MLVHQTCHQHHYLISTDRNSGKYALVYASLHFLRWKLATIIFPRLCLIGFNYAQPFLISSAISYISQPIRDKNDGYGLIAATGLIYLGIAVSKSPLIRVILTSFSDQYNTLQTSCQPNHNSFPGLNGNHNILQELGTSCRTVR